MWHNDDGSLRLRYPTGEGDYREILIPAGKFNAVHYLTEAEMSEALELIGSLHAELHRKKAETYPDEAYRGPLGHQGDMYFDGEPVEYNYHIPAQAIIVPEDDAMPEPLPPSDDDGVSTTWTRPVRPYTLDDPNFYNPAVAHTMSEYKQVTPDTYYNNSAFRWEGDKAIHLRRVNMGGGAGLLHKHNAGNGWHVFATRGQKESTNGFSTYYYPDWYVGRMKQEEQHGVVETVFEVHYTAQSDKETWRKIRADFIEYANHMCKMEKQL